MARRQPSRRISRRALGAALVLEASSASERILRDGFWRPLTLCRPATVHVLVGASRRPESMPPSSSR